VGGLVASDHEDLPDGEYVVSFLSPRQDARGAAASFLLAVCGRSASSAGDELSPPPAPRSVGSGGLFLVAVRGCRSFLLGRRHFFPLRDDVQGAAAIFWPFAVAWAPTLARTTSSTSVPAWKHAGRAAAHPCSVTRPHLHGQGPQEVPTWKHAGRGVLCPRSHGLPLFPWLMAGDPPSPRAETLEAEAAFLLPSAVTRPLLHGRGPP
jgi:hypothetical protein